MPDLIICTKIIKVMAGLCRKYVSKNVLLLKIQRYVNNCL